MCHIPEDFEPGIAIGKPFFFDQRLFLGYYLRILTFCLLALDYAQNSYRIYRAI